MSVSDLSSSQASAMGLIQGTGTAQTQSVNDVLAQSQGAAQTPTAADSLDQGAGTQTLASPAAMSMIQLQRLAASDPTRFKAVTQKISDQLASEAKSESNPQQSKFLENLSDKFAAASQSGSMASLDFHKDNGQQHLGNASTALGKYSGQENSAMSGVFSQVGSIISSALSSVGSTPASTAQTASSTVASVAASGGTEA
jgi:hypothetical protein